MSEDVGAVLLAFWKPESVFFSSHLMDRGGDLSMYPTPKPKAEHPSQQEGRTGEQRGGVPEGCAPKLTGGGREERRDH